MPLFNHVAFLNRSVMSVIDQKTDFNIKLIIIDDCSTDGSYELALNLEKKYKDKIIVYKNKTNLKLLKSIYQGYAYLKGFDYFCVLDPDDWYTSDDKFQVAVDFLEKHKKYSMYMNNISILQDGQEHLFVDNNIDSFEFSFEDYKKKKKTLFIQTSGVVYRNIYFKESYNKKFSEIFSYPFPQSFRADGFRWFWYLKSGPAFYCKTPKSVYNYNGQGIWSQMKEIDQSFVNSKLYISCSYFFKHEREFFQKQAFREIVNSLIKIGGLEKLDEKRLNQLKDILKFIDFFKYSLFFILGGKIFLKKIFYRFLICLNFKTDKIRNKLLALKIILKLRNLKIK